MSFTAPAPLVLGATAADGTTFSVPVGITAGLFSELPSTVVPGPAPAGEAYFEAVLGAQPAGSSPRLLMNGTLPPEAVRLVAAGTTLSPQVARGPIDAALYVFVVPDSTTTAVLQIGASQVAALEQADPTAEAKQTTVSLAPASVALVAASPPTTTTTLGPPTPLPSTTLARPRPASLKKSRPSSAAVRAASAGGGGLLVIAVVVPIVIRRRRYARADRAGQVVIVSPPELSPPPPPALGPGERPAEEASTTLERSVRMLGPLEIGGLVRPLRRQPAEELFVFLVLHPGRSFTSAELRSAIWVLGRREVSVESFRNYVLDLRRSLGPDVLVTTGTRYRIAVPVHSDVAQFRTALANPERATGLEEALGLVRGPVLAGAFDGRNAPYTWALPLVHELEAEIQDAASELAELAATTGDMARADWAIGQGLRCSPTDLRLLRSSIALGLAVGGAAELDKRLTAARARLRDFPADVEVLEAEARRLAERMP